LEENDFDMWLVINCYRPLTSTVEDTLAVMEEIRVASGLPFTGIVNNSNLGAATTPDDVLASVDYAKQVADKAELPLIMTTVEEPLFDQLKDKIPDLFPLRLQTRIFDK
jgi:hypothetical protein